MQAVTVPSPGGPDALVLGEAVTPDIAPDEVLVATRAAGVNRADLVQRRGHYDPPPGASTVPGLEIAGEIVALGAEVTGWSTGDRVAALLAGGGYAGFAAVPQGQLLPIPGGLRDTDAAGLPEVLATVYSNIVMAARLAPGEWLLVHGGGSGIGTAAIQVAKELGNPVAVTVGSVRKAEFCRRLGADVIINYRDEDFVERVRGATDGRGADVILDLIGGPYLERNLAALATGGRLAIIALQGGAKTEINLATLMTGRKSIIGTTLRARPAAEKAAILAGVRERLWPAVEAGRIKPIVDRVLPLAAAADAHRALEDGDTIGKIILEVTHER